MKLIYLVLKNKNWLLIVFLISYIIIQWFYYGTRYYPFNPFIQNTPIEYNNINSDTKDIVILCLGGSTTNDDRLPTKSKYLSILKNLLEKQYPNKSFKVLNGGYDWYTTKHSLINYTTHYNKFKPDFVIIMHAINDICRSFTPVDFSLGEYSNDYTHFYGSAHNAANPPTFEKHTLRKIMGDYKLQQRFNNLKNSFLSIEYFKSINSYKFYLSNLIRYVQNDNSTCLVIEQPFLYSNKMTEEVESKLWFGRSLCNNNGYEYPNYKSMNIAMQTFNNASDSICKHNNIDWISTFSKFSKDTFNFKDDVHYTVKGSNLLAKIVFDNIKIKIDSL